MTFLFALLAISVSGNKTTTKLLRPENPIVYDDFKYLPIAFFMPQH